MEILWCGQEDVSFQNGSLPTVVTDSGHFRSSFARGALQATVEGNPSKGNQFPGGAVTSGWLTSRCWMNSYNIPQTPIVGFGQFSSVQRLFVGTDSTTANKTALYKYDATLMVPLIELASESGTALIPGVLQQIVMQVINYGSGATVNVFVDGNLVITFTGDVTCTGMSAMDCVVFGPSPSSLAQAVEFSEAIVSDQNPTSLSLLTQAGTSDGDTDAWTGAYTDCNELTLSDSDSVYTDTTGLDEEFDLNGLPGGTWSILACLVVARANKSSSSLVGTLELGWKTNSVVSVDSGHSLGLPFTAYERLAALNPVTAFPWQPSDINALQIDLHSAT